MSWLLEQNVNRRGSILADEMGLGKTISAIALMMCQRYTRQSEEKEIGPILIVCPGTVINQWMEELALWASNVLPSVAIYNS